jgi:hypothetical protein
MPASTETPRFGEMWEYEGNTRWIAIAPDPSRTAFPAWTVLYVGTAETKTNWWAYTSHRIANGRSVLDSMVFFTGKWEKVS